MLPSAFPVALARRGGWEGKERGETEGEREGGRKREQIFHRKIYFTVLIATNVHGMEVAK